MSINLFIVTNADCACRYGFRLFQMGWVMDFTIQESILLLLDYVCDFSKEPLKMNTMVEKSKTVNAVE